MVNLVTDVAFERAVTITLRHEGGYNNDPRDTGGETKFGISKRAYPTVDIKSLTEEQAKAIYKRDFWDPYLYKSIKDSNVANKIFDLSVNVGPTWAHRITQRALKAMGTSIVEDGHLGYETLVEINKVDPENLLSAIKACAAGYYRKIAATSPRKKKFLSGWLHRAHS